MLADEHISPVGPASAAMGHSSALLPRSWGETQKQSSRFAFVQALRACVCSITLQLTRVLLCMPIATTLPGQAGSEAFGTLLLLISYPHSLPPCFLRGQTFRVVAHRH